eukprot:RCo022436
MAYLSNDVLIFGVFFGVEVASLSACRTCFVLWNILWCLIFAVSAVASRRYLRQKCSDAKIFFVDPADPGKTVPAPNLTATMHLPPRLSLSVVIPAYNEEERLPIMLEETLSYLNQRSAEKPAFTFECIVVDDHSSDRTSEVTLEYARKYPGLIHLVRLPENHGKGYAVKQGAFCSSGRCILMADADGATRFSDLAHLEREMCAAACAAGGSMVAKSNGPSSSSGSGREGDRKR